MPKTAGSPSEGIDHPTNAVFRPSRPICHLLDPSPVTTRRLACTQVEEPALLQRLYAKFPEGHERPRAAPRDGAGAPLIKALIVNGKAAVDAWWKHRGYDVLKPDAIKARLGYRLDREEALGYVILSALDLPLPSPLEARTIGKRAGFMLSGQGAIGKALSEHRKHGLCTAALLQEPAALSLAPPKAKGKGGQKAAPTPTPAPASAPAPPPPAPPQQQPYVPPSGLPEHCQPACKEVAGAIDAALRVAMHRGELEAFAEDPDYIGTVDEEVVAERLEVREAEYRMALLRLRRAVPQLGLQVSELVKGVPADRQNSRRGPCGRGRLPHMPWELYMDSLGHCFCDECSDEMHYWRCEIADEYAPELGYATGLDS